MSVQLPPYRPLRRRNGLKVMLAAIHALLMRELQTRFGGYRLGYLWAPLEVFLQVIVLMLIFGAIMSRVLPGMDYMVFLLVGIIPFNMFRRIARRSLGAVEANRGLMLYRAVRQIDVLLARAILEFLVYFFSFWLLLIMIVILRGVSISLENLDVVLWCWLTFFMFSFGISLIMLVVGHYTGELSKVIGILFTFLYILSGIIYTVHIVHEPYLSYLMYNPIIHNLEAMRHAISPTYPNYHVDMWYFLKWMIGVDFLGLLLYKAFEDDFIRRR